jgi:hypothetical protein
VTQFRLIFAFAAMAGACSKAPERTEPKPEPAVAPASGLIGKWCFKPSSVQATWDMIEISKASSYTLSDHFGDGTTRNRTLDVRGDSLWERDSDTGDRYVLPSAKGGDLIVADNGGEIGKATALKETATPTDCFQS